MGERRIKNAFMWNKALSKVLNSPQLDELEKELVALAYHKLLAPDITDVFKAFELTDLDKVRVVIIGQDPYINGEAHGLSFSSKLENKIPPSLRIIFKELVDSGAIDANKASKGFTPNLTTWAEQGVLLLNVTLTTVLGTSNKHKDKWWFFMKEVLRTLSEESNRRHEAGLAKIVVLLWGKFAEEFAPFLPYTEQYLAPHPAAALYGGKKTFLGCNHFNYVNEYLVKNYFKPIDWGTVCKHENS